LPLTVRSNAPCLELPSDEMRQFGYRVVDILVEHLSGLHQAPVGRKGDSAQLRPLFAEPPPEQPVDLEAALRRVLDDVLPNTLHVNHPRFFGFVPGPGNFVSAMADALSSGFNVFNGSWMGGSGAAALELAVVDWFRNFCGLPESGGGIFVSGGSVANMTALAVARHVKLGDRFSDGVVYFSDQTHSSVDRALRVLGFTASQLRRLPSDENFRLDPASVADALARDRAAGLRPFCIVVNAGTTNTGAVDPIADLVELARANDLWIHADGAFGAAAAICDRGRRALAGLEQVDSLSLDPHKWLFQSFECGCVLLRDVALLKATYQILPDYLQDLHRGLEEVNPCDYGIQLTRSFRALKVWLSMQAFGLAEFRRGVERGFELAERAEARLRQMPDWEVLSPAQMGTVAFRYLPRAGDTNAMQTRLVEAMLRDGFALVTSTVLRGLTSLRMCTINPRTSDEDIDRTLERLNSLGRALDQKTMQAGDNTQKTRP
jgi:aromatic-L-amino-acid/L-tryptophan decarboxylase